MGEAARQRLARGAAECVSHRLQPRFPERREAEEVVDAPRVEQAERRHQRRVEQRAETTSAQTPTSGQSTSMAASCRTSGPRVAGSGL